MTDYQKYNPGNYLQNAKINGREVWKDRKNIPEDKPPLQVALKSDISRWLWAPGCVHS